MLKTKEKYIFIFCLIMTAGCGYHIDKVSPSNKETMSYDAVMSSVFAPRCLQCHSSSRSAGAFDCSTYDKIKEHLSRIEERVIKKKDMPPGSPLSELQMTMLTAWINAGAPEYGNNSPSSTPSPTPTPTTTPTPEPPLLPKFASFHEKIFVPKCIGCHSAGQPGATVSLNTAEDLLKSPRSLVLPGNSAESGLILAIKRKDKKRMPPPNSGIQPLSQEEIAIIAAWIDAGAKE